MIRRTDDTNGARYANSSGEPLERTENKEHYPIFRESGDYGRREIGISAAEEDSATAVEIGQATRRTSSTLPVRRCLGESSRYIWAYVSASRRLRFRAAVSVGLSIRVSQGREGKCTVAFRRQSRRFLWADLAMDLETETSEELEERRS